MISANSLINPTPKGHKAKRGDCGTCHWFDRVPEEPKNNEPWAGWCLYAPPIASQTHVQTVGGVKPMFQGVVPPTLETRRCHLWRPFGVIPNQPWEDASGKLT